jgi:hypothetical protein
MFVFCVARVHRPFHEVERAFAADPARWLRPLIAPAFETTDEVRIRLGARRVGKSVRLLSGDLRRRDGRAMRPIRIEATGPSALFPRVDADLEIAGAGAGQTQISLQGSYQPPLGRLGELLDRTMLHRVAEVAMQRLVDQIAAFSAHPAVGAGAEKLPAR